MLRRRRIRPHSTLHNDASVIDSQCQRHTVNSPCSIHGMRKQRIRTDSRYLPTQLACNHTWQRCGTRCLPTISSPGLRSPLFGPLPLTGQSLHAVYISPSGGRTASHLVGCITHQPPSFPSSPKHPAKSHTRINISFIDIGRREGGILAVCSLIYNFFSLSRH
ncbi:hypothetical protein LY78DRAFT_156119 [Colletotrichum sublineola]|nr:hypothetical protein LY78DRAFT_156119 [Colletotrichum sublineola]